jgi:hypothetical protein
MSTIRDIETESIAMVLLGILGKDMTWTMGYDL